MPTNKEIELLCKHILQDKKIFIPTLPTSLQHEVGSKIVLILGLISIFIPFSFELQGNIICTQKKCVLHV